MQPDEAEALADACHTVAIANLMLIAKHHNPRKTAIGLLAIAQVLLQDDLVGRITFAALLGETIAEVLAGIEPNLRTDTQRRVSVGLWDAQSAGNQHWSGT